jgi:shikimate kinase
MNNRCGRRNIVLTGFMATGKSSVGRQLALRLEYDFVDVDCLIEAEAHMSIPEIFTSQGEAAFRELEARMVERAAARIGCVIATGGGAIVDPRNFESLSRSGIIVTLTADPDTILSRIGTGTDRPMLKGGERRERIQNLLAARASTYAKAHLTVDTSRRTVDEVVDDLLNLLRSRHLTSREGV